MFYSGDKIGPYTLVRELGRGGFGRVWLAERRTAITTTQFALKLTLDENPNFDAIKHEAELWKQAGGHPNVLPIIEADVYDGRVVIVSEYAPDGSLEGWLRQHQGVSLSIEKAIEIISGILAGLTHLHTRRVIHRDLKPANILLQGEAPRLADFGIARVLKTNNLNSAVIGTPPYMAPEAFKGARSEQTDVWSVGVIFYELVAGYLPFMEQDLIALIMAIATQDPRPLPNSIPNSLQKVIFRALDKNTEYRYRSAKEMQYALREASSHISHNNTRYHTTVMEQPRIISPKEYPEQSSASKVRSVSFFKRILQGLIRKSPPIVPSPARVATFDNRPPIGKEKKTGISLRINPAWLRGAFIGFLAIALIGLMASTYYYFASNNQGLSATFSYEGVIAESLKVNLRSEPGGTILAVMPAGTRVRVLEDRGEWLRIRVLEWSGAPPANAPDSGWVDKRFITR